MDAIIRKAILKAGSLPRAMAVLRQAGLAVAALNALEAAASAESELASNRGKTGDRSKIEPDQIAEIGKLLKQNLSYGEIAKRTGLSKGTIFKRAKSLMDRFDEAGLLPDSEMPTDSKEK